MYQKQNFVSGQVLTAEHMNKIEDDLIETLSKPSCFYVCQKKATILQCLILNSFVHWVNLASASTLI